MRLGASPRASLQLVRAAKAWAAMEGRDYVIPDDLQTLVPHAFGHRLLLTAEAHMSGRGPADVLASIVSSVADPARRHGRPQSGRVGDRHVRLSRRPDRRERGGCGSNWRAWLAGFTTRACCLLAAGVTAVAVRPAARRDRPGPRRRLRDRDPARRQRRRAPLAGQHRQPPNASSRCGPSAGTPITVSLTVTNRSVLPTGALMMEDTLPSQLHGRARFVLDGLGRRESRAVTYRIPPLPRGRYEAGPLRLRLTDPFRMVDLNRSFTATSTFVLTPVGRRAARAAAAAVVGHRREHRQPLGRRARRR